MSNIFTLNPIKVNVISVKNVIQQTIMFIGIVPGDVKKELLAIQHGHSPKKQVLEKFYGKAWAKKLGFETATGGCACLWVGGDPDDLDMPDDATEQADEGFSFDVSSKVELSNMISFDDLMGEDTIVHSEQTKIQQITTKDKSSRIRYIFDDPYLSVYPEDKILEFKKKIYAVLDIPIFRQHIWYVHQGRSFPLNYSLFNDSSLVYVNAQNMLTKINSGVEYNAIEGIPIDNSFYMAKKRLNVTTDDTFSVLSEFFYKNGVTEYNMLDLDAFVGPARASLAPLIADRHQLELMYYSFALVYWPMLSIDAFAEYLKDPAGIAIAYPDLMEPREKLLRQFKLEKKIIDEKYDISPQKAAIRKNITNSIISAIISVLKFQNSKEPVLRIRNLFDRLPLTDFIISAKARILHDGKIITLVKTFKNAPPPREELDINSLLFKINPNIDGTKPISLIFHINGNYVIKSTWREEKKYNFDDIFNIVKIMVDPIIKMVNALGVYVLINQRQLPLMTQKNTKFTEIGMHMFYRKSFTEGQFDALRSIMRDYRKAGIVTERSAEHNVSEYYFKKGMYQFKANRINNVIANNNYYDFMTDGNMKQRWYTIFEKTRITKIYHRFSDIKIEIIGIKEHEFPIFYDLIVTLFKLHQSHKIASSKVGVEVARGRHSIRNLKEQDPLLYNFKKIYKTENIYSKICQKPYQPILLNKQGYDALETEPKSRALKYWNFTTNKEVYYVCPNHKFPYIKFIVKRHPKDFCIPCCKKARISKDVKDPKRIIHDICLKSHKYMKAERTVTIGSRYIMAYGKDVEPGRLSRLPEDSLEPLFYETYSIKEKGIDYECLSTDGYYIYGTEQLVNGIDAGMLSTLSHAMEITTTELVIDLIKHVKESPNKFRILLNGNISKYFNNIGHFIDGLGNFLNPPEEISDVFIPWNDLFVSAAYLFFNINIIYFTHQKNQDIKMMMPVHITSKAQFLSTDFRNIIVLKKRRKYYPIYLLNTDVFFKTKTITKKIFDYNTNIVVIISRLVDAHFKDAVKKNIQTNITLTIVQEFVGDTGYKIHRLYINSANMCYYVHLKRPSGGNIYVPIEASYYLKTKQINITYDMFFRKSNPIAFGELLSFVRDFNQWVAIKSQDAGMLDTSISKSISLIERVQPIYPFIKTNTLLVISKPLGGPQQCIGFSSGGLHYYTKTLTVAAATKASMAGSKGFVHKTLVLYYDPDIINKAIFAKEKASYDTRCLRIGKAIYETHLYQLMLLEYMEIFGHQRNTNLRKRIKSSISSNLNKDFDDVMECIKPMVSDAVDYAKIRSYVCDYATSHHIKNRLMSDIDNSVYIFDQLLLHQIKTWPYKRVYAELMDLSKKFVEINDISKVSDFTFPNMYVSCQQTQNASGYCKKKKFIISKHDLEDIVHVMAGDIINPAKEKWLFGAAFTDNVIAYLKFIRRPNEHITIAIREH
jgi:hypothetical protein